MSSRDPAGLPEGTLVFLRSDIEGSMRLTRELGAGWEPLLARHHAIVRNAIAARGGHEVRTEGDAFVVVFRDAGAAAAAAVDIQRAIAAEPWPAEAPVQVRIGLHAGAAHHGGDDYAGFEMNRAARIGAAGWGGQIVLSEPVRALIADDLPWGCSLRDLGWHRLKDVPRLERLHQLDVEGLRRDFPALATAAEPIDRLPTRTSSFVGREADLAALDALLDTARLVTLTGPGGTGKTTLAVEAARRRLGAFEDGVWFVDLAPVADPTAVRATIARAVGLFDGAMGSASDRLPDHLRDRELLLVLDNLEHLIGAATDIAALLDAAPRCRALATSRAALRVRAEQEYPVRPLGLEGGPSGPASECALLFLDRARHVAPRVTMGEPERATVDAICARLDGLPLAIELAAARCGSLPLRLIHDRLAAHLPLPGVSPRDLPERQRTLEATVAWSADLLPAPAARLLARIAVFEGGFELEQAEAVCGPADELGIDVLDGLVLLAEQSLLERVPSSTQDGVRFRPLETIRAFALGRLEASGEEAELRARHAAAFLALAETFAKHLFSWRHGAWIDRLAEDDANVRVAMAWGVERSDAPFCLRLMGAAWRYWLAAGQLLDARRWVTTALALPGADAPLPVRIIGLDGAAGLAYWGADLLGAHALYLEQLALARRVGGPADVANACFNLGHTAYQVGDEALGSEAIGTALETYRELGDARGLARQEMGALLARVFAGGPGAATAEMLVIHDRLVALEDLLSAEVAAGSLGWFALNERDPRSALHWMIRAGRYAAALRDDAGAAIALSSVAVFVLLLGRPRDCARLLGAFEAQCQRYGVQPPMQLEQLVGIARPDLSARELLAEADYEDAYAEGGRLSIDAIRQLLERIAAEEGIELPAA